MISVTLFTFINKLFWML